MKIGIYDADNTGFPNLALMKISAYHKQNGNDVEWANPLFGIYDILYISRVFKFTEEPKEYFNAQIIKYGGTGYNFDKLDNVIDQMQPDYSIYPYIDNKTAYGFLTRGCINKCKWCIVPLKEGYIKPYMDIEEIAINRRKNIILMDNNILACDYGLQQIEKIINLNLKIDFNQALDARLVTEDIAKLLSKVKWLKQIRFGCDTSQQIIECEKAMNKIDRYKGKPMQYLLYTMIDNDIQEAYSRVSYFKTKENVCIVAQPFRDYNNPQQVIPQWQKDMARWSMRSEIYKSCDFKDDEPRTGFKCRDYFY